MKSNTRKVSNRVSGQMKKLTELVDQDPRIKEVYDYARKKYEKANLAQHNFEHVIRDLFRALVIAE